MQNTKQVASRWSELPEILAGYLAQIEGSEDQTHRLFGYASLISDHAKEKPENSATIPNEPARLYGMQVDMNIFAVGPYEFRGTNDRANGIVNTGLYAGMGPAPSETDYAAGLVITTSLEDAKESLKAFIQREMGDLPATLPQGTTLDDLFDPAKRHLFEQLRDTPQDDFAMYQFEVTEVETLDGKKVPAVTASTNMKSPFQAIGISPQEAAHYILTGAGSRGNAKTYFDNFLISHKKLIDDLGVKDTDGNPDYSARLLAIDTAIPQVLEVYRAAAAMDADGASADARRDFEQIVATLPKRVYHRAGVEVTEGVLQQRLFPKDAQVAERTGIDAEYKKSLPADGKEQIDWVLRTHGAVPAAEQSR